MSSGGVEPGSSSDNVQVAVRCRPLNPDEEKAGHSVVVRPDSVRGEITLVRPSRSSHGQTQQAATAAVSADKERTFTFDSVFGFDSKQVDIYNETARPIVDSVLEGYNG